MMGNDMEREAAPGGKREGGWDLGHIAMTYTV